MEVGPTALLQFFHVRCKSMCIRARMRRIEEGVQTKWKLFFYSPLILYSIEFFVSDIHNLIPQYRKLHVLCSYHLGTTVKKLVKGWKGTVTPVKACLSWSIGEGPFYCRPGLDFFNVDITMKLHRSQEGGQQDLVSLALQSSKVTWLPFPSHAYISYLHINIIPRLVKRMRRKTGKVLPRGTS